MKDKTIAQDALQDALMAIVKGVAKLQDHKKFHAWIYQVTHNKCLDIIRKNHKYKNDSELDSIPEPKANETDVDSQLDMMSMIKQLPHKQKNVIHLFYYDGFSIIEIANILKKPAGTIKSLLFDARATLKFFNQRLPQFFFSLNAPNTYVASIPGNYAIYLLIKDSLGNEVAKTEIQVLISGAQASIPHVAVADNYTIDEDNNLVANDADGAADVDATNNGVLLQDYGSSINGNVNTSVVQTFNISHLKGGLFQDGFEDNVVIKIFDYIEKPYNDTRFYSLPVGLALL